MFQENQPRDLRDRRDLRDPRQQKDRNAEYTDPPDKDVLKKEVLSKSEFPQFVRISLEQIGHDEAYDEYASKLAYELKQRDWDLLTSVDPLYLKELGIKPFHEKIFIEAIKRRIAGIAEESAPKWLRPAAGGSNSQRWRIAAEQASKILQFLPDINLQLNGNLIKCEEMIDLLLLAMFCNEHIVLLGPPGTAKTTVANRLAQLISDGEFFYNLMTRFTTPDEVFGPVSLPSLKIGELKRNTSAYLPTASIALLDEIFKSSSIILNSILDILNERTFKNNGKVRATPLLTLIGASNEMPAGDLSALFDRFTFRFWTQRLDRSDLRRYMRLINTQGNFKYEPFCKFSWDAIVWLKEKSRELVIPEYVLDFLNDLIGAMDCDVSERRVRKAIEVLKVNAVMEKKQTVTVFDCLILKNVLAASEEDAKRFGEQFKKCFQRIKGDEQTMLNEKRLLAAKRRWRQHEDLLLMELLS